MTARAFDETAEGWDASSDTYARVFAPFTSAFGRDIVRLYPPRASESVLEVAAGTGSLTEHLWNRAASLVATDISPQMIARIAKAAEGADRNNVTAAVMDAEHLDSPSASYDAVYCMFGVMFFSDRERGFCEMARVLRPGGHCVISTWSPRSGVLRPLADVLTKLMPGSPPAKALSGPPVLGTLEELTQELRACGFDRIELHEVAHDLRLPSPRSYMEELLPANPNGIMMKSKLPKPLYDTLCAQLEADLRARFGEGPVVLEGVANIVSAVKPA